MAKRNLLLVDSDPRSLRVLEVSLRKAGYSVTTSADVDGALELVELTEPDMILADTRLPGKDGFVLVAALKARPAWAGIPLVFLSSDPSVESKVRGLELGVEDYLTKPVYIREILTRVDLVMQRQEREGLSRTSKTRFAGSLADMGLVDLLQTIDVSRKSGVLQLSSGSRRGSVYFHEGRVLDAELGELTGEAAIYRFLVWNEGEFELDFREVRREDKLGVSTQGLLMEGMRRLDELSRLQEQLPSLGTVFDVSYDELAHRLAEIPDEINEVLRSFDGRKTLAQVLDDSRGDDLAALNAINKLYFEGFLIVRESPAPEPEDAISDDVLIGVLDRPYTAEEEGGEAWVPVSRAGPEAPAGDPAFQSEPSHAAIELQPAPLPPPPVPPAASAVAQLATPANPENAAPIAAASAGVSGVVGDAEAQEPVALGVVKLKRVALSAESGTRRPLSSAAIEGVRTSPVLRDPRDVPGESALEIEEDMAKRAKRKSTRPPEPAAQSMERDLRADVDNVIKLPVARPEPAAETVQAPAVSPQIEERRERTSGVPGRPRGRRKQRRGQAVSSPVEGQTPAPEARRTAPEAPAREEEELDDDEAEVERFFSSAPPKAPAPATEHWGDLEPADHDPVHHRSSSRGKAWTLAILAVGLLTIGGFLLYHKVLMPTPEDLGGGQVALPTPDMLREAPPVPEPKPEPVATGTPAVQELPSEPSPEPERAGEQAAPLADPSAPQEVSAAPQVEAPPAAPVQLDDEPPLEPEVVTDSDAEGYRTLLAQARKQGFRRAAESSFLQALSIQPRGSEALSGLAMLYLNQGKNAPARDRAREALRADPRNSEAWIVLGAALSSLGDPPGAREAYAKCADLPSGKYVSECRRMLR